VSIVSVLAGLAVLLAGARWFVGGVSAIAAALGVSPS
jgi:Ca2+/Na+ antiporter